MDEVFRKAKERFGRVDILVNCAGFSAAFVTMTSVGVPFELQSFHRLIDVRVFC